MNTEGYAWRTVDKAGYESAKANDFCVCFYSSRGLSTDYSDTPHWIYEVYCSLEQYREISSN